MTAGLTLNSRRTHERRDSPLSVEELIDQVSIVFANAGIRMNQSKVSRLVRGFKHRIEPNGFAFVDYLVNSLALTVMQRRHVADELVKVIAYADPVGEEAVRRVMRERNQFTK